MDNNINKDLKQMLNGAESLMKSMEAMTKKTFESISPEQAKLFVDYFNQAKVGDKLKELQKQTEELKKAFK